MRILVINIEVSGLAKASLARYSEQAHGLDAADIGSSSSLEVRLHDEVLVERASEVVQCVLCS